MSAYGANGRLALSERIGDIRRLAGYQRFELLEGRGKGNEVIAVRNGSGLHFHVNVSRGFDIGQCEFHGIPIGWISHAGPVAPHFYEKDGTNWNRGFEGGLLATCGLSTIGKPSVDQGEAYGQHGRISYIPAELLQTEAGWTDDDRYEIVARGRVKESDALQQNIVLDRTIRTGLGDNRICLTDRITNDTFLPAEHLIMYHFNFGFPLVGETCDIMLPEGDRRWINGAGATDRAACYEAPSADAAPTVMLHENMRSDDGMLTIGVRNRVKHLGADKLLEVRLTYSREACPCLTQWKFPRRGVYVLGLEPGNATTEGRRVHRERGTLPFLEAGETKTYEFIIDFDLKDV